MTRKTTVGKPVEQRDHDGPEHEVMKLREEIKRLKRLKETDLQRFWEIIKSWE